MRETRAERSRFAERLTLHVPSSLTTCKWNYRAADINSEYACVCVHVSTPLKKKERKKRRNFSLIFIQFLCHPIIEETAVSMSNTLLTAVSALLTFLEETVIMSTTLTVNHWVLLEAAFTQKLFNVCVSFRLQLKHWITLQSWSLSQRSGRLFNGCQVKIIMNSFIPVSY